MQNSQAIQPKTVEKKIGRTTYIITSSFNENARETAIDKVIRLIKNDTKN